MVFFSLVAAGSVYAIARSNKLQYASKIKWQVVDQIRGLITTQGFDLCGTTRSLTVANSKTVQVSIACTPYSDGSVSVTLPDGAGAHSVKVASTVAQQVTATLDSPLVGGVMRFSVTPDTTGSTNASGGSDKK